MKTAKSQRTRKGNRANGVPNPRRWQTHYRSLLELRERLVRDRGHFILDQQGWEPQQGTHLADAASDEFDRDLTASLLSFESDALAEIEAALTRIANGTYGICELTGKWIPEARLKAIPWARFTAEAKFTLENGRHSDGRRGGGP